MMLAFLYLLLQGICEKSEDLISHS